MMQTSKNSVPQTYSNQTMVNQRSVSRPSRRDWLRWGSLSALSTLGLGPTNGYPLLAEDVVAESAPAKSCILIWLDGGPSHLETFDLKPDAPVEVRGPFKPTRSNVVGMELCEHLRFTSRVADKLAVIRSMTSPLGEHGLANQYLLTGYKPSPVIDYPSLGAVVSYHHANKQQVLPSYVTIPDLRNGGTGFLGSEFAPFATGGDPARAGYRVRDIELFPEVTEDRLMRRGEYLRQFESIQRQVENAPPSSEWTMERAFRLMTSTHAKAAFDLQSETDKTRERYGPRMLGQSCLLARRLVESGVPFVSINHSGWDTHDNLVLQLRDGFAGAKEGVGLLPTLDQAFSALIQDLSERGLLSQTLVVVMGEFGRTPKLNTRGGRDHWPGVFSVLLAGGGIRGGQAIGSSDSVGESPKDRPTTPADLAFTIYKQLGIDPRHVIKTSDGRPVEINRDGQAIEGLT